MNLIIRSELTRLSIIDLRGAYRATFNALVTSAPETAERRNALATLENICAEIAARMCGP